MPKQIVAIRMSPPADHHHHIVEVQLSDLTWKARIDVANDIDSGRESYFVTVGGATAIVETEVVRGVKYIRTHPDATGKDNLLNLPRR